MLPPAAVSRNVADQVLKLYYLPFWYPFCIERPVNVAVNFLRLRHIIIFIVIMLPESGVPQTQIYT